MVLLLAVIVVLFFSYKKIGAPVNNIQPVGNNVFSIIDDKDYAESQSPESYKIGSVEVKLYPQNGFGEDNFKPGWFEVYNNGQKVFASNPNFSPEQILVFKYQDNKYSKYANHS